MQRNKYNKIQQIYLSPDLNTKGRITKQALGKRPLAPTINLIECY